MFWLCRGEQRSGVAGESATERHRSGSAAAPIIQNFDFVLQGPLRRLHFNIPAPLIQACAKKTPGTKPHVAPILRSCPSTPILGPPGAGIVRHVAASPGSARRLPREPERGAGRRAVAQLLLSRPLPPPPTSTSLCLPLQPPPRCLPLPAASPLSRAGPSRRAGFFSATRACRSTSHAARAFPACRPLTLRHRHP